MLSSSVLAELDTPPGRAGKTKRSGRPRHSFRQAWLVHRRRRSAEFAASYDVPKQQIVEMCHRGQQLFARLSKMPAVTVAAIDGICVGGGAELAIWCDRRVMTVDDKTQFGFPEVKLGLFPGWGGTARASRIIGLGNAVELITSGELIDAHTAALMGLATDTVSPGEGSLADRLLDAARRLVRAEAKSKSYLADRQKWSGPIVESETELGFLGATASGYIQQQTGGHYPAPLAALEVMLGAAGLSLDEACDQEARGHGQPVRHAASIGP